MSETVPTPTVHILKEGRSYCEMPGVPKDWPDNHLFISFQDQENAKEANCPGCLARRDAGPHLADRLNGLGIAVVYLPDGPHIWGPDPYSATFILSKLPDGVALDTSCLDAFEEKTGQSARFDPDLGRWHKVG